MRPAHRRSREGAGWLDPKRLELELFRAPRGREALRVAAARLGFVFMYVFALCAFVDVSPRTLLSIALAAAKAMARYVQGGINGICG